MRKYLLLAGVVAFGGLGIGGVRLIEMPAKAQTQAPAPAAVPVQTATATRADVPVYETGLGSVQAFNTVTVKVRVDGELDKVAFTEGQMVKAGDVIAEIDPRPFQAQLDQTIAKEAQDEAELGNARLNLQRDQNLVQRQYATQQSVDTEKSLVAQLEAAVKGDQAAIENAKVQLGYTNITAPISGRTGIRLVDQGNIVHAADTGGLVVITQLQPISAIFTLPEDKLSGISAAMAKGPVTVEAFAGNQKEPLDQGTIALVDNQIDQTTGTIRLKATFPNHDNKLWPGQFVDVRVVLGTERNVVTLPSGAVQRSATGLYVYRVKSDDTVENRPIEVGQNRDDIAVVTSGLQPGDRVVTAGQYRLQPGTRIAAAPDTAHDKPEQTAQAGQ